MAPINSLNAEDASILSHPLVKYMEAKLDFQQGRIRELESAYAALQSAHATLLSDYTVVLCRVEELEAEVKRLKNLPKKPRISASTLDKDPEEEDKQGGTGSSGVKRPGSSKQSRDLEIDEDKVVEAKNIAADWKFVGYRDWEVSDLRFERWNIRYKREVWVSPCGEYRQVAALPVDLQGSHFGARLKAYVLNQYHSCGVTQPLLYQQLKELGVRISKGQLNNLLIEGKEAFDAEKEAILSQALSVFGAIQTDDTGARHGGKNGFCNCICNEYFTYFKSTSSKSRINFLEILHGGEPSYRLNEAALEYATSEGLGPKYQALLLADMGKVFETKTAFATYLAHHHIGEKSYARRYITEACLIGSLIHRGLSRELGIHSDGARQFDIFVHSLCWKHAERPLKKLIPHNEVQQELLNQKMDAFWKLYQQLKNYRKQPQPQDISQIEQAFEQLCQAPQQYLQLQLVLEKLAKNKEKLLRVLYRPEMPIQNNQAERDIREYVKRRKISGSTRSEKGRKARDTFASLKKTCRKLGISFWEFLLDRIQLKNRIPPLDILIAQCA